MSARQLLRTVVLLIAFAAASGARAGEGRVAFLGRVDGFWQVFTMSADGSGVAQVTRSAYEKANASWYADGESLLVGSTEGQLVRVDLTSGVERSLEMPVEAIERAVVSPDGTQVAFTAGSASERDGNDIWTMSIDGSNVRQHTSMNWLQNEPAWSPDGKWLYFASGDGQVAHDLWRVSLESGAREQLTSGQLYHFGPAVSVKGDLAFSSNRSGNYEIWIDPPDGAPFAATEHPALDGAPSWGPRGEALLFHSTRGSIYQIWRLERGSGAVTRLTDLPGGARNPVWWFPAEAE